MEQNQIISGGDAIGAGLSAGRKYPMLGVPHYRVVQAINVPSAGVNLTDRLEVPEGSGIVLRGFLASALPAGAQCILRLGGQELERFSTRFREYPGGILLTPSDSLEFLHTSPTPIALVQIHIEDCLLRSVVRVV